MWDSFETKRSQSETVFFEDWISNAQKSESVMRSVRDVIFEAEAVAPEVTALRTVVQSPPYHSEGLMVMDHLERMLTGLFAIIEGASLLDIEEFAREQSWHPQLRELEETMREYAATLEAFVFIHDLAKSSTVSFTSTEGSVGASEGFIEGSRLDVDTLSQRYSKLVRSVEASDDSLDISESLKKFYDQTSARVHYYGHAQGAMEDRFEHARDSLSDLFRLGDRDREVLALLVRSHIDVIKFFKDGADPAKIDVLLKRSQKVGLDGNNILDLQLAVLLLDTAIGSLHYKDGKTSVDIGPFVGFLQSEQQGAPDRLDRRHERLRLREARELKSATERAGIDAISVIELLKLPVGHVRAEVLEDIRRLVMHSHAEVSIDEYPTEILNGITRARALYQSSKRG
ncbi:hypothetical protein HON52_03560 [Candidatus Uhrbacteria bacterium]|jgi:hypothetical protein|nr:hypothetical protein [Candidatus Uhrbacteria bacterium]